ncbi:protein kinase [Streptomyces sp. NPDC047928]|uniref:protein kinase domain-containing protein n=1 Tax=unclassified Streptomyces TaxID=2593676 RepID=UPI003720A0EF
MNAWSVPGYTETRELGSGASGRVVLAVHDTTGVPVAVKYLSEALRTDTAFVHAFRGEARLLAALRSPYVVGLYEYVEAPDGAAIVMELVDGLALRAVLKRHGPVGPEAALVVLKGSLLGLAAAHGAGVVHRDYKPENVLVAADGSSTLVDFGIAVDRGAVAGVAGTPAYMAPEQWTGGPASPAADVYAATATFYECLTGRKPFTGDNFAELALRHLGDPVPEDDVPEPVLPLIRKGLAKAPEDRPQEAALFVEELEAIAGAAYGPDWEERGRGRLAALAALLPLLFPSAGERAESSTDVASTSLGGRDDSWWYAWKPNGLGISAMVSALVLALILTLGAHAGDNGARSTSAQAVATTGVDGTPATPSPAPSASASASTSPQPSASVSAGASTGASPSAGATRTPTTTPAPGHPGGATPSPGLTGSGPTHGGSPFTTPPTEPPPTTTEPPTPTPVPPNVKAVSVTDFRQTDFTTATATFDITTDGTGPLTLTVTWATGDTKGAAGTQDGATQTFRRSGATHYTLTLTHTFQGEGCYWSVRAGSDPAPANGGSTQQLLTRRCELR